MNKIQLAGVWLGCAALAVYFSMKNETSYFIAAAGMIAIAAVITYHAARRPDHEHYGMPHEPERKKTAAADAAGNDANTVLIPKPFGGSSAAVFKKESFEYREKTYNYRDISGIFYNTVSLVVHGIPTSQTYSFGGQTREGKFNINFASALYINNDRLKALYAKLVGLAVFYIEPGIVSGMIKDIFKNGKTVKIGPLEFTKKGFSRKKLFGGAEFIAWDSRIYIPQIFEGYVYVYRDKNGKPQKMKTLSMQAMNAVVLPNLVQMCYDEFNGIKKEA